MQFSGRTPPAKVGSRGSESRRSLRRPGGGTGRRTGRKTLLVTIVPGSIPVLGIAEEHP